MDKRTILRKLLRGQEIVDERLSHFLQRLRTLADNALIQSLKAYSWINFPESARGILAVSSSDDLDSLAASH